jgi:hypothetical protein
MSLKYIYRVKNGETMDNITRIREFEEGLIEKRK